MNYHVNVLDASVCLPPRAHCSFSYRYPQWFDTSRMGDQPLQHQLAQSIGMSQEVNVDG